MPSFTDENVTRWYTAHSYWFCSLAGHWLISVAAGLGRQRKVAQGRQSVQRWHQPWASCLGVCGLQQVGPSTAHQSIWLPSPPLAQAHITALGHSRAPLHVYRASPQVTPLPGTSSVGCHTVSSCWLPCAPDSIIPNLACSLTRDNSTCHLSGVLTLTEGETKGQRGKAT